MGAGRARGGLSMVELLIAVAVLGGALLPIVSMANHNVEMLRAERSRLLAESLCHDVLERLGCSQAFPGNIVGTGPGNVSTTDPWLPHPELFDEMGYPQLAQIAAQTHLHMTVTLDRAVAPELDLLVCEVTWVSEGWKSKAEKFRYSRFLTYGHMPVPH